MVTRVAGLARTDVEDGGDLVTGRRQDALLSLGIVAVQHRPDVGKHNSNRGDVISSLSLSRRLCCRNQNTA